MGKKKVRSEKENLNRRDFLKIGSAGAAIGALSISAAAKNSASKAVNEEAKKMAVKTTESFPYEVREDYMPGPSYSTVHGHGFFGRQLRAMGIDVDEETLKNGDTMLYNANYRYHKGKKGWDQLAKAVSSGAWALSNQGAGPMPGAIGDYGLTRWTHKEDKDPRAMMDTDWLQKEQYKFNSKEEAANAIKRAARLYGADLVGITQRDERWDYSKFFSFIPEPGRDMFPMPPQTMEEFQGMGEYMKNWNPSQWTYGWEKAGFTPKSVIVLAFEMDYEAVSASTCDISNSAAAEGYSQMTKTAYQLAVFFRQLGYKAIPTGNDTGISVPYAIAAGLGEGSRMGQLVTYKYGPRVRIAKVYTEFDFVEYDKPKLFGVHEFCKRCKRCADACPAEAIPLADEPTFEPTHENKDNAYFNFKGVKKWYVDARKCFKQWADGDTECANCICACPYNKPDFWHHRMVDGISAALPGPAHSFMRKMDEVFGYGNVDDEEAMDKFFDPKGRSYDGF